MKLWMIVVLLGSVLAGRCLGDGIVLPRSIAPESVTIPDQQALISYADGVETLAIETRFIGSGGEYAWVVPVPSCPEVSAGTSGTFPSLRGAFAPHIWKSRGMGVVVAVLCLLLMLGFVVVFMRGWNRWFVIGLICFLLLPLTFPTLGKARSSASQATPGQVQVHERRLVGSYDTATISSEDAGALSRWLTDNGFALPAAAEGALNAYVAEGWWFVASKLRMDVAGEGPMTPHPLVLRFRAAAPVYPMRLTAAVIDRPLSLELYVFGAERAKAKGMRVECCGTAGHAGTESVQIKHTALEAITGGTTFGTKLAGTFTKQQAAHDIEVQWNGTGEVRPVVVDEEDRSFLSALGGVGAAAVAVWALVVRNLVRRCRVGRPNLTLGVLLLIGLAGALITPMTQAFVQTERDLSSRMWGSIGRQLESVILMDDRFTDPVTGKRLEDRGVVLERLKQVAAETVEWSGERFRLTVGDGPGQFVVRDNAGMFEVCWYNAAGVETVVRVIE